MSMGRFGVLVATSLVSIFLISGCGKGVQFGIGNTSQSFTQNGSIVKNSLDILWVVDNSGSMAPFQTNLTNNFSSFISTFTTQGYDFHMAVTTSDAYLSESVFDNQPALAKFKDGLGSNHSGVFILTPVTPNLDSVFVTNASQGSNGAGDERAFSSFRDSLNSPLNSGFLRSNSFLSIIILSDEDDFSSAQRAEDGGNNHDYNYPNLDTVDSYVSYLDTLTQSTGGSRRYNVNAITVQDNACLQSHLKDTSSTTLGLRYIDMVGKTGGVSGSICDASYASTLSKISNQITVLSTQFYLNRIPQIPTIVVTVNGRVIAQDPVDGWTYSSTSNSIQFHGASTPQQNATITINFTPVSIAS